MRDFQCTLPVIFVFGFYHAGVFLHKIVSCTSLSAVLWNNKKDLMEKLCSP